MEMEPKLDKQLKKRKVNSSENNEGGNISDIKICDDQLLASPVLNKRPKLCVNKSPVIVTDKKNLIKLKKAILSSRKGLHCVSKKLIDNFETNKKTETCVETTKCDIQDIHQISQISQSSSSDLSETFEYNRIISPSESPSSSCSQHTVEIGSTRSPGEEMLSIECDPSQSSSRVDIDVHSSPESCVATISTSSSISDSLQTETHGHESVTSELNVKQSKKFKVGTNGYSLQKLLVKQKNDIALWQHEMYLASTCTMDAFQSTNTDVDNICSTKELKITSVLNLFGCMLLDCVIRQSHPERCFLLPHCNSYVDLHVDQVIRIYPSYFVSYLGNGIKLLSNVNKIQVLSRVD